VDKKIEVGDRYLYRGNHYFYTVKEIVKEKLLQVNSDILISFEAIENVKGGRHKALVHMENLHKDWFPMNGVLPIVSIYEGMIIHLPSGSKHFIYDLDDTSFWLIPVGSDPEKYLFDTEKKFGGKRSTVDRAQRLFYTGWWKISK
jgi:hypothetical protein